MTEPAVRLTNVSKRFQLRQERRHSLKERAVRGRADGKELWALRNATFEVPKGSCFGLIGPNGSGKSTTLKVMAGIYRPTTGSVEVNGRMSALLELGAGFHPELTGRENIRLNGAILGLSRSQIDAATDEIIEFAGLADFIDSPVKIYSSGMYVRLGFAISVAVQPEILVVDEIIAVGDETFQRKCFDHFHSLRRAGSTVILVSHGMGLMSELCDEIAWVEHGDIKQLGPAADVVGSYLKSVNVQEEVTSDDGLSHVGTGEVKVAGIELLDPRTGEQQAVLVTGEPATIRVHFEALEAVQRVAFGLRFFRENGVNVATPSSARSGFRSLSVGRGWVDFTLDEFPLTAGLHEVSTVVSADGSICDLVERQFVLRVRSSGGLEGGLMRMSGDWTFTPDVS